MKQSTSTDKRKIATVENWKASGLSQAAFCRREGLQQWQLSEWKRFVEKLENEAAGVPARSGLRGVHGKRRKRSGRQSHQRQETDIKAEPPTFVPVQLVEDTAEDCRDNPASVFDFVLEVVLKRGQIIRVAPNCEPQFLGAVVSTLDL